MHITVELMSIQKFTCTSLKNSRFQSNRNSVRFYKLKGYDAKSGETGMCSESDIYDVIKVVRSELYDNNNVHGPLVVLCL